MSEFKVPVTLDDAKARRRELLADKNVIQRELTERRIAFGHGGSPEYNLWRKRAVLKIAHIDRESAFLRDWIKDFNLDHERVTLGGETYQDMRQAAVTPFFNFLSYAKGLRDRVAELEAENAKLRDLLRDQTVPQAPGDGVDEWREQA